MSIFKKKKVLITGASGLVGRAAIDRLLAEDAIVIACVHKNDISNVKHKNFSTVKCNLLDFENCLNITSNIDYCLHFAAHIRGASGKYDKNFISEYLRKNLLINVNILNASVQNKIEKFGFVSSSTIYPDVNYPVTESEGMVGQPHKAYLGIGNLMRYYENLITYYQNIYDTNFALIRTTAIYGPFDNFNENCQVIPMLINKAKNKDNPFEVWGDGSQIRDFVYVNDVVDGLFTVMEKSCNATPFNIASGEPTNIKKLVNIINEVYNHNPDINFDSTKPTMIPIRLVDISKANTELNWFPSMPLYKGICKTIKWYNNFTN